MDKKNIIVLFSGTGTNLQNLINKFANTNINIIQTITNNPKAYGITISKNHNIPCEIIDKNNYEKNLISFINSFEYDLIVLSGYMKIVSPEFISSVKSKIVNIHPSLLPSYKGLHAIPRSYEGDENDCGVTVHYVNEEVDGGEIILQKSFDKSNMTFEEFEAKIKECEFDIFPKAINIALS